MNPQWILIGIAVAQAAVLALQWRTQRDQARQTNELKEWIDRKYIPRELADALYMKRPDPAGISAISKRAAANP